MVAFAYAASRAQAIARLAHERSLVDALQRTLRVGGTRLPCTRMGSAYASASPRGAGRRRRARRLAGRRRPGLDPDRRRQRQGDRGRAPLRLRAVRAARAGLGVRGPGRDRGPLQPAVPRHVRRPVGLRGALPGRVRRPHAGRCATPAPATARPTCGAARWSSSCRRPARSSAIDTDQHYATATVPLAIGDVVLLATDGLSEARDARRRPAGRGAHRGPLRRRLGRPADAVRPAPRRRQRPQRRGARRLGDRGDPGRQGRREQRLALPFSPLGQSAS